MKGILQLARIWLKEARSKDGRLEGGADRKAVNGFKSVNSFLTSVVSPNWKPLVIKTESFEETYEIKSRILGKGASGKVRQCINRKTGEKFALKVREKTFWKK